jgi:hypothetical protein
MFKSINQRSTSGNNTKKEIMRLPKGKKAYDGKDPAKMKL